MIVISILGFKSIMNMKMNDDCIFPIAKKICELSNWRITNLSIQKVIYFCHMFYLGANNGKPLIDESFEAWDYGPVLPSLYHKLKMFGADPIESLLFTFTEDIKDVIVNKLIEEVAGALVDREAWELVALTHSKKGAWVKNYYPNLNKKISNTDILVIP